MRHDAVVSYEGLFRDEQGRRYLVTEYVDGPPLAAVIAGRRLEPDEILRLRDRLADGLAAVHGRGIIHRDLSPENIILPDGDIGRAKLTGFGFAKTAETGDATLIGVNLLTHHTYASPEQLGLFGGHIDSRSDLYSLGLVLASAAIGFGADAGYGGNPGRSNCRAAEGTGPVGRTSAAAAGYCTASRAQSARPPGLGACFAGNRGRSPRCRRAATGDTGPSEAGAPRLAVPRHQRRHCGSARRRSRSRAAACRPRSRAELRRDQDQLAAATASHGCGSVSYSLGSDRKVRISGYLTSAEDVARVQRQVTAIAGISEPSFDIALTPRSHCEMAALLGPLADPAVRDGLSLAFAGNAGEISIGEQPSLDVRVPGFDGYLYIDYFDSGGQVLHLFPNGRDRFNLRPWRNRFILFKSPLWTVCGNVGQQLVTIVATAKPLFPARRPDVEDASDYIGVLGEALRTIPPAKAAASLLFFELRDAPPWINRELACPSG